MLLEYRDREGRVSAMEFDRRFVFRLRLLWLRGNAWRGLKNWCSDTIDAYGAAQAPAALDSDAKRHFEG